MTSELAPRTTTTYKRVVVESDSPDFLRVNGREGVVINSKSGVCSVRWDNGEASWIASSVLKVIGEAN